ncbi:MAG: DUF5777 family beta-barrel protein [Chitinophagaceae bacterium]|nr:DUF5777 family beta-barrel protein [Chitinophagaceae bacterium]
MDRTRVTSKLIKKNIFAFGLLWVLSVPLLGQEHTTDDLENLLVETEEEPSFTKATFKSSRIINGHSVERVAKNSLEFRISHRFGEMFPNASHTNANNTGLNTLYGIFASANIRLAVEYGISDRFMIGIGRSNYQQSWDGFAKFAMLRQGKGKKTSFISLVYLGSVSINGLRGDNTLSFFTSRLAYTHQLLIARKFNEHLSLQLMPTLVHKNLVDKAADMNLFPIMGFGGRFKISKRVAITGEYFLRIPTKTPVSSIPNYENNSDSFSLGIDIETGGHVFQLFITNSAAIIEKAFLVETNSSWKEAQIRLGFNITREFEFQKRKNK